MALVEAFNGIRYDLAHVGALSDVIAPPYDVIDSKQQGELYDRHPANVVRLELNRAEPGDDDQSRYQRAGRLWKQWQLDNIVRPDSRPSFYVLHQIYEVEGRTHVRRGLFARVKLERFGEANIFPHEATFPGPKVDRLRLMETTAANLSPVFGVFPDELDEIQELLDKETEQVLPIEAKDHLGVTIRLWPVNDPSVISRISGLFHDKPIFIADGHHRFETCLEYRDQLSARMGGLPENHPANFILMALVGMSDPGLLILPTHRIIRGYANLNAERLQDLLGSCFECEEIGAGTNAGLECWERMQMDGSQDVFGFCTASDQCWQMARLSSPEWMTEWAGQQGEDWRSLAVSRLHVMVIDRLLKSAQTVEQLDFRYVHLYHEVAEKVEQRKCDLAVLVPPVNIQHVSTLASQGARMPQKSTYFYPKIPTGLVFHSLR